MKGIFTRYIAFSAACIMIFGMASCGETDVKDTETLTVGNAQSLSGNEYTKKPTTLKKSEAVFVTLSADGTVEEIMVTDRLTADSGKVRVDDISSLRDIKNIKGTENPVIDGENVVWHMDSQDLYYSGTTQKSLPAEIEVEYTLNGEKIDGDDIKGKNGTLKIDIKAENKLFESVEYNGKIIKIYTPFLIVGGTVLTDTVSGVTVTNGTSVGDGQKEIAFGFMLPGITESLGFDKEKINIPESFSMSYSSSSHENPSLMFAMIPLSLSSSENILTDLFSGTEGMSESLAGISKAFASFTNDSSIKKILSQSDEISKIANTAMQTVKSFSSQTALINVLSKHITEENEKLLADFSKDISKVELSKYAKLMEDPTFQSLMADMGEVSESFSKLIPFLTSFSQDIGAEEVQESLEALPQTVENLSKLSLQLQGNKELLDALTALSQNESINELTRALTSAEKLFKDGAADSLSALMEDSDEFSFRITKLLETGKKYSVFTEAPKDAETSVYFIFKTQ